MQIVYDQIRENFFTENYKEVTKIYESNKKDLNNINLLSSVKIILNVIEIYTMISNSYLFIKENKEYITITNKLFQLIEKKFKMINKEDKKTYNDFIIGILNTYFRYVNYLLEIEEYEEASNIYKEICYLSNEIWYSLPEGNEKNDYRNTCIENYLSLAFLDGFMKKDYEMAKKYIDFAVTEFKDDSIDFIQELNLLDNYIKIHKNLNNKDKYIDYLKNINDKYIDYITSGNIEIHFENYCNRFLELLLFLEDKEEIMKKNKEILQIISFKDDLKDNKLYKNIIN